MSGPMCKRLSHCKRIIQSAHPAVRVVRCRDGMSNVPAAPRHFVQILNTCRRSWLLLEQWYHQLLASSRPAYTTLPPPAVQGRGLHVPQAAVPAVSRLCWICTAGCGPKAIATPLHYACAVSLF